MAAGLGSPDVHGECWTAELFIVFVFIFLGVIFQGRETVLNYAAAMLTSDSRDVGIGFMRAT